MYNNKKGACGAILMILAIVINIIDLIVNCALGILDFSNIIFKLIFSIIIICLSVTLIKSAKSFDIYDKNYASIIALIIIGLINVVALIVQIILVIMSLNIENVAENLATFFYIEMVMVSVMCVLLAIGSILLIVAAVQHKRYKNKLQLEKTISILNENNVERQASEYDNYKALEEKNENQIDTIQHQDKNIDNDLNNVHENKVKVKDIDLEEIKKAKLKIKEYKKMLNEGIINEEEYNLLINNIKKQFMK